jgi:hypothetical protein
LTGFRAVAQDQRSSSGRSAGATISIACGPSAWPSTRRHRLVPLKKACALSSQAVRTELS